MASQDTDPHEQEWNTNHPTSAEEAASPATPHYHHPFPFTIVPNSFLDDYLPRLSPTAQSLMLIFYRLTLGWHRNDTFVSLNELRQRTGIASYPTLDGALKDLWGRIDHGEHAARVASRPARLPGCSRA